MSAAQKIAFPPNCWRFKSVFTVVSRLVRHCLNLLSTMVSQGVEAAREVFSHIHIKALSGLEKRRDKLVRFSFFLLQCFCRCCKIMQSPPCVSTGKTRCPSGFYSVCLVLFGVRRWCNHWANIRS